MRHVNVWKLTLLALCIWFGAAFAQDAPTKVDQRVWSNTYWKQMAERGLVSVAKESAVKKGVFGSSKINALTSKTDDSPDVLIIGGANTQSENSVFVNPNDNLKVFNSNNSTDFPVNNLFGANYLLSTDGGLTWGGSVNGAGGANSGDPAAVIGLNGEYYVNYIAANGGNGTAYSTDEGATWTHVQVDNVGGFFDLLDKNHMWIDNSPTSPHEGNLYAAWTRFETGSPNDGEVEVSRSTDGGRTWETPIAVSTGLPDFKQGVSIQTASDGTVYAFYTVYLGGGVTDETDYGMSVSTDGGATWSTGEIILTGTRGVRVTGVGKSGIRSAAFPVATINPLNDYMYMVWPNIGEPGVNTGNDINVYVIRSTNGGTDWDAPVRVSQSPQGQGFKSFLPWITSDPETGALSVIFYDDRNVGGLDLEVFVANSVDGGQTWEDFKVSDVSFTPAPIPGLAGGYFGDYLAISARGSKVYPIWTDNRDGQARAYSSPFTLADPDDPSAVGGLSAASDFSTPTDIALTWTDPTTLIDGTPISSSDFTIEITRDGAPLTSVAGGVGTFTDNGLTDGTLYEYGLTTKLVLNDSLSTETKVSWYAGGSPFPSTPTDLEVDDVDTVSVTLKWNDPDEQSDGTELDDLDSIRVYRNGSWIASVAPDVETYTDMPPAGFTYSYTVTALDNETPANESGESNSVEAYVGSTPDYLVWVGEDAGPESAASGDSIAAALAANGKGSFLTNDLFEFGTDLSVYEGIFVVLGIFDNNHVIEAADAEGPALDTYVQNGGFLYLESGDGFNYDPEQGGFNIRPWFDLEDGPDGAGDLDGLSGVNDLSDFAFTYSGENNFMDQLQVINSTPIWRNSTTDSVKGVFNAGYGTGRTIGAVMQFSGLDNSTLSKDELERRFEVQRRNYVSEAPQTRSSVERQRNENFVKKYFAPQENIAAKNVVRYNNGAIELAANNKVDLMAAYLELFNLQPTDPAIAVNPTSLTDTVLVGGASTQTFSITNVGGALANPLEVDISLGGFITWVTFSPEKDTLSANESMTVTVEFNSASVTAGTYDADLTISSNDPTNPSVTFPLTLVVDNAPVVGFSPDSLEFTLAPAEQDSAEMIITNTGAGPLNYELTADVTANARQASQARVKDVFLSDELRAEMQKRHFEEKTIYATEDAATGNSSNTFPATFEAGEEVFGSDFTFFTGADRDRGNFFEITTSTSLLEYKQYLDIPTDTELYFVVYEGAAHTGLYTKIAEKYFASSGTGIGFYSSGSWNVPLEAGKFYYFGVAWGNSQVDYYRGDDTVPIAASFGALASGNPSTQAGIPPGPDFTNTSTTISPYYCSVTTGAGFLEVSPTVGSVLPNESDTVMVKVNSEGLLGGSYSGSINISSNDPATPVIGMPVNLTVTGTPVIDPVSDSLFFPALIAGFSDSLELEIANTGNAPLSVTNITSNAAEFSVSNTSLTIAPFETDFVTVYFSPSAAGNFTADLSISSDDPATPTAVVYVEGEGLEAPVFSIDPDTVDVTVSAVGDSIDVPMLIENTGGSDLEWSVSLVFDAPTVTLPKALPNSASSSAEVGNNRELSEKELNTPYFGSSDIWDLQFEHDVLATSGAAGNAGAEYDGQYFYSTRWASNLIHKYEVDGNGDFVLVEEFSIPGVTGLRDLAWDGQYMYGGAAGNTIFQMDFANKTLVSSFASSQPVRHIAYDEASDAFYVGNWTTDIALVDKSGTTLSTIPVATHGGQALYGSAYDSYSAGGPYLWIFDQTSTTTTVQGPNVMKQLSLPSGTPTGVEYDVVPELGNGTDILLAGGMFITDQIVPGKVTIGGMAQGGGPDRIFGYELADAGTPFVRILDATSGVVASGDVGGFTCRLTGLSDSTYKATLILETNDPAQLVTMIPVTLTVDGAVGIELVDGAIPTTYEISRNYPNPFNPTTTIDFQLPQVSDVTLSIYNVLGQKVRTLVNERMNAGSYQAVWDARNDNGVSVSSGVYIYRFEANNFNSMQKMILLK